MKRLISSLAAGLLAAALPLPGQDTGEPGAADGRMISLDEAIQFTLSNNLAYRIASLDPQIAREAIVREEAVFDSELFATGRVSQSEQSTTFSQTTGTSSDTRTWNAGVRRQLATGTTLTAETSLDRRSSNAGVNTSNLSQSADLALSLRQPLLRGFGRAVNTAGLESARAGFAASLGSFRDQVWRILTEAEAAYWTVARWQEQLELAESRLEVAETLLQEARERERVGLATKIEVLQAEASRAEFLEDIIETNRILEDAYDQLLTYMGVLLSPEMGDPAEAFQVARLPGRAEQDMEFETVWRQALSVDPQLAQQEATVAQRQWDQVAARNALKPNLDLVLSGAYTGLDDKEAETAYESAFDRDGHFWAVGFEFSMPWGRRGEKAALTISENRLQQATLRYDELKQSLYREVRAAWRNLRSINQSLEAARLTVSLQEAAFEREKIKFEQGLSVFRDVLEVQRDLDNARIRLLQARYNSLVSDIEIDRLTGRLLERHGIPPDLLPED